MGKSSSKLSTESLERLRFHPQQQRHHDQSTTSDTQRREHGRSGGGINRITPSSLRNPKTSSRARGETRDLQVKNLRKGLSLDQLPLDEQLNSILDDEISLVNFLTETFHQEVEVSDSMQTLFRGNCMASKIMSHCFRSFGSKYIKELLEPHIKPLIQLTTDKRSLSSESRTKVDHSNCSKSPSKNLIILNNNTVCASSNDNEHHQSKTMQHSTDTQLQPKTEVGISYEIDSTRLEEDGNIDENRSNLLKLTKKILDSILSSTSEFPAQLNLMCICLRQVLCEKYPNSNTYLKAIGTVIFLRFINPAIVAPFEAGIVDNQPAPRTMRGLMLVSKILQNIANNVEFSKEEHMLPFNDFVRTQFEPMHQWVNEISSERPGSKVAMVSLNNLNSRKHQKAVSASDSGEVEVVVSCSGTTADTTKTGNIG